MDIKKAVLRGVYEDNAGLPRTTGGKGRSRPVAAPEVSVHRSRHGRRAPLIVLLGLVALAGINFRLVTVDGSGPVAMQRVERPIPEYTAALVPLAVGPEDGVFQAGAAPASAEPVQTLADTGITTGQYDAMLASLGMPMAELFNLRVQTIVIDPGHGGIDSGATGHQGLKEKDVVLDIAKRLRNKLATSGNYRVLLTREDDRKVYLKERVAFAKEHKADLFISIHINSLPAGKAALNYVETYYFGPQTDQRSRDLAEQENRESDYVMGEFREVIARIGDTLKTEESKALARSIHKRLYRNLRRRDHGLLDAGTKTGPFMVLLGVEVPSVLVEVSCISNRLEEARLSTPGYRDSVANYLKSGIVEYLERRAYPGTIDGGKTKHVAKKEG